MNYQVFMVPGILVILVTMVGAFLSALNIVKEKEIGTIEQINVTPIKKYQFILGKLIPFWVLGLIVLTIGLLISRLVYGIIPIGNISTVYVFAAVYLLKNRNWSFSLHVCKHPTAGHVVVFFHDDDIYHAWWALYIN